jgi:hypothetical protein
MLPRPDFCPIFRQLPVFHALQCNFTCAADEVLTNLIKTSQTANRGHDGDYLIA